MRWKIFLLLAVTLVAGGIWLRPDLIEIPARWNPFALPDPAEPPGFLTSWQLRRLQDQPEACFAWLEGAGVAASPVPDRSGPAEGCGLTGAATLRRSDLRYNATVTASCPLLAGLVLYERHVLIPAARRHFNADIANVRHYGTYACRAVRTTRGEGGRRSQHATANAIDIAAVTLADGTTSSLISDWDRMDDQSRPTAAALFWRDAHKGGCQIFRSVLGPDYNDLHRDHFHLDMGPFGICR
ncbi:extensin family protein [Niveispirillum irakense]|uniref:extensin-like domain-containing protein n=1 Tax=Niveispirillum irakense TaxID=34011 RepID=UPI000428601A|nr:extensin family protein [Niveispirillum irakense]